MSGRRLDVLATWYAADCCGTGRTATGARAGYGVIAVDPTFILLGTRLWVPGYGWGLADDTGRDIVGRHIDLCFDTSVPWERAEARVWGARWVTVVAQ